MDEGTLLNGVCDMSHPGRYVIQLSRAVSENPKDGKVKSNKVTITVTQ